MNDYEERYKTRVIIEKLQNWKIFEYLVALENGAIMWSDISSQVQDKYGIPHRKDYGIDLISPDFSKTFQVKYSHEGRNLSWTQLSTFLAYSVRLKIFDVEVALTTNIVVKDDLMNLFPNFKFYNFLELCEKYQIRPNNDNNVEHSIVPIKLKKKYGGKISNEQAKLCIQHHNEIKYVSRLYSTREYDNMIYIQKIKSWILRYKIKKEHIFSYEDEIGEIIILSDPGYDFDPSEICSGQYIKKRGSSYSYRNYDNIKIHTLNCEELEHQKSYDWLEENIQTDEESDIDYYNRYQNVLINPMIGYERMLHYLYSSKKKVEHVDYSNLEDLF